MSTLVVAIGATIVAQGGDLLRVMRPAPPAQAAALTPAIIPAAPQVTGARQLVGGWRFPFDYQRGAIAIDFSRMKLWMVGHVQRNEVLEYDLSAMGTGTDVNAWPAVSPTRTIQGWWPAAQGYGYGLIFWRGKLWVSPRVFYDQGAEATPLTLYAQDGETIALSLPRQVFSGFVKRGPGQEPLIGGGGYESGQGTAFGPSLATLDGRVLRRYQWAVLPGANREHWNDRAPREPNYSVANDDWLGWKPRVVNGVLQGRWASDRIYGGGLLLPEGVTYYAWMGTSDLDYARQTYTFAPDTLNRTYEYRYSPDGQFLGYAPRPDLGVITGQERGADGFVYLADAGLGWTSGPGNIAVKVFR